MLNKFKMIMVSSLSLLALTACGQKNLPLNMDDTQTTAQSTQDTDKDRYGTAKRDIWIAESTARRWDASARLVQIEGRWVNENGTSFWTYYFTSPFKKTALKVDGSMSQEVYNNFFGIGFSEFQIRVDSDKAIELAKKQGLKHFPVSEITLGRSGGLEWEIRSSDGYFRVSASKEEPAKKEKEAKK